jgi:chitin disaccharide deacetylase
MGRLLAAVGSQAIAGRSGRMLIINADDWGRSKIETDVALRCYKKGRITSLSAMVFMEDSERAAEIAKQNQIDAGLHLNFSERFTGNHHSGTLADYHQRTVRFLTRSKYSQLVYNPFLQKAFAYSYKVQVEEFGRLYGKSPSHVDGHHHMHLCANLLFSDLVPSGTSMRRNFSFWPGEKSALNRAYRRLVDGWLARKYRLPDYFFDLTQSIREKKLERVMALAKSSNVELMTHPIVPLEMDFLMSDEMGVLIKSIDAGTFTQLGPVARNVQSVSLNIVREAKERFDTPQSSCGSRTST